MIATRPALDIEDDEDIGEPISRDASYTRRQFMRALNIKKDALKALIAKGLPIKCVARRKYILGSDWLKFLEKQPDVGYAALEDN